MLKVDHVLALYLVDLAEHVIVNFYKSACVFIRLFRNCINDMAWERLANYKLLIDYESTDADSGSSNGWTPFSKRPPLFTATKSACVDSNGESGVDMVIHLANALCT